MHNETLEKEKPFEGQHAEQKSFDVLASINMMRFDMDNFGSVLPETMSRIYDEELTYVAEGINLPFHKKFQLKEIDGELTYFNEGEWQSYASMLDTGLLVAEAEAEEDPRKAFLVDWARRDREIGGKFSSLQPNESLEWYSSYRYEEERLYGEEFLESVGLQPQRSMGFLYRAYRDDRGRLFLESCSVDNSDEDAFCAAMAATIHNPNCDMDTMKEAYDEALSEKYGGTYNAGRAEEDGHKDEANAWEIIAQNKNLARWYFDSLKELAASDQNGENLEGAKRKLTYGYWGAIKKRMDKKAASSEATYYNIDLSSDPRALEAEARNAYLFYQAKGEVLIGCGGSTSFELSDLAPDAARDLIFGEGNLTNQESDKHGSLQFNCPKGHSNTRPRGQLIESCKTCGTSVKC